MPLEKEVKQQLDGVTVAALSVDTEVAVRYQLFE
jgi:hypothetical protein